MILLHKKSASGFSFDFDDTADSLTQVTTSKLSKFKGRYRVLGKEQGDKVELLDFTRFSQPIARIDNLKKTVKISVSFLPFSQFSLG